MKANRFGSASILRRRQTWNLIVENCISLYRSASFNGISIIISFIRISAVLLPETRIAQGTELVLKDPIRDLHTLGS